VATSNRALSWGEMLLLWAVEAAFYDSFVAVLARAPWEAVRWETSPLLAGDLDQPLEFVLFDS